jgi:hypothetical protein
VNPPAPKTPRDLMLAPISVEINENLERIRDKQPADIDVQLQLELDRPPLPNTPEQRGAHVLHAAVRNVELHQWTAEITPDACRLRLAGGSVTLDLGLSATIMRYIENGVPSAADLT